MHCVCVFARERAKKRVDEFMSGSRVPKSEEQRGRMGREGSGLGNCAQDGNALVTVASTSFLPWAAGVRPKRRATLGRM